MKIDTLEPDVKAIVETILAETSAATGLTWVCVQGRRTMSEQADLYAKGRTQRGPKVTNAPPGSSAHNYGLAADCAPLLRGTKHSIWWEAPAAVWSTYGAICERHGLTWGGNFRTLSDRPHCEHPRWKTARDEWRKNGCRL
jgi:peptidoglycan LD-endopeptidase CwlK